jgi:GNAT superfamily N-acetyltransferase
MKRAAAPVILSIHRVTELTTEQKLAIMQLCTAAYEENFDALFELLPDSTHVLAYLDGRLVSHAAWVTRWLAPEGMAPLRTAYVEAVATLPAFQGKGFATTDTVPRSNAQLWTSRILSGLPALFLLIDGAMKLFKPAVVVEATTQLGLPESLIVPLGVVLLISTVLYLVPRTSVLGVILLTGYLGGAVNTHVRSYVGWFPILFPTFYSILFIVGNCQR